MTGKEGVDEVFDVLGPADPGSSVGPADRGSRVGPDGSGDGRASIVVRVQVSPGAGRTAIVGRHGDAVKLRVAAPPTGGRANEAVVALLASTLGVGRDHVALVTGGTGRAKRLRVDDVDVDEVRRLLGEAMAGGGAGAGNARGRRGVR